MARVITLTGLHMGALPSYPSSFDYCQPPEGAVAVGDPVATDVPGWTYTRLVAPNRVLFPDSAGWDDKTEYREYKSEINAEVFWVCGKPGSGSWKNTLLLGAVGAGCGYFLLKPKVKMPMAALIGAAAVVLPVMAFRPGGWLRKA